METQGKAATAIVTLVLGLLVGGGVGYAISNGMETDNHDEMTASVSEENPSTNTKAAGLRVTLNQAMRQHVALASVALKDAASGAPETDAAVKALDNNSVEIADAVGSVYGDEARNSFLELWRNHIGFFVDYTTATVKGDKAGMKEAKANIDGYTDDASSFFANANPNIDKAEFKAGLAKHGSQVFGIVDAYAAKDYTKAFALEEEAYNHIGMAADNLAAAIVKQSPDKF